MAHRKKSPSWDELSLQVVIVFASLGAKVMCALALDGFAFSVILVVLYLTMLCLEVFDIVIQ